MEEQKLLITLRVKNTELMDDTLDIIREHIQCELGYIYGGCVLSDCDASHKELKVCIKKAFDEKGRLIIRKHMLDSSLCDAIRFNISGIEPIVIGPYLNENGETLTSDFFVNETDFDGVLKILGSEEGVCKEKLDKLCSDDAVKEKLIGEWLDYISEEESNLHGKTYLKELIKKYVI